MSLWSELKRRNVVRVAAAYLVASWVLIEVASLMFDAFGFPPIAIRILIAILALGLLPILVFSWVYELTPDGLVRDTGPERENPENARTARRLDQVTIAMILIALGVLVVNQFVMPARVHPATANQGEIGDFSQSAPTTTKPALEIPEGPSVAVLPFANMSPDPDNEYFADGISEEILNVLASVEGLKVASRTSAFSFRDSNKSIAEIAATLGVANILEGSVRKQDNRVRITAQLIDASTDLHLWSESYDRQLDDIFAVQEEIAQSITNALSDALGIATVSVKAPTGNLEAYELYLKGRTQFYQRGQSLVAARQSLEKAVALDDGFAQAWAMLAATIMVSPSYLPVDSDKSNAEARTAALRARALDDSLPMPYAILGTQASFFGDQLEARRLLDEAVRRDPDHGTALLWRGLLNIAVGDFSGAEVDIKRAHEIEPLVGINNGWLGTVRLMRGDPDEAEELLYRSADLGWGGAAYLGLAAVENMRGNQAQKLAHLREYARTVPRDGPEGERVVATWLEALEDPGRKQAFFDAVAAARIASPLSRWGMLLLHLGEYDRALESEIQDKVAANPFKWQMWMPGFQEMFKSPLFIQYARSEGLLEHWETHGFPDGCSLIDAPEPHLECSR